MDAAQPPPQPAPARSAFHVALGLGIVPVLSLPFVWLLAISAWLKPGAASDARFRKGLYLLAAADALAAAAVLALWSAPGTRGVPIPPRSRIGIELDREAPAGKVRVARALPGSPAERAGVLPGDVIVAVDHRGVQNWERARRAIGSHAPGETCRLVVMRDGRGRVIGVVTEAIPAAPAPPQEPKTAAANTTHRLAI
jgi:hypothetical protein